MPDEPLRLRGVLTTRGTLTGRLTGAQRIVGRLSINRIIQNETETYEGPYIVDPSFEQQLLETNAKMMADDVTIHPIAVSHVSNPFGGNTVYIGGLF